MTSPDFDLWADGARGRSVHEIAVDRYRLNLVKTSEGFASGCPKCGDSGPKSDRFTISTKKNLWHCRQCAKGGDAIELLMHTEDMTFVQAVTEITGEDPPGRVADQSKPLPDENVIRERREERRAQRDAEEDAEKAKKEKERQRIEEFWGECLPFKGSQADHYLRGRKIVLGDEHSFDLRYVKELEYKGFADGEAAGEAVLGRFPAMIAAIRTAKGKLIGVHRTYLQPGKPAKLSAVGDPSRFKAKKVWGAQLGGFISLSPPADDACLGEGIETTTSFYQMGVGPDPLAMICGVNLGNIYGGATDSVPHPKFKSDGRRRIPNGIPDPDKPGLVLPTWVKRVILLVDGDSEWFATRAKILTAGRRIAAQDVGVSVSCANDNADFNDMLRERSK